MVSQDFRKMAAGYGLTTAHILYRRPDHRWLLQSYVWQAYDLFPKFPELQKFLEFWQEKLEAPLHSVQVAHCKLIPIDLKVGDTVLFGKWSGTEVKIDGQDLLIMKESDIMGVIEGGHATKRKAA